MAINTIASLAAFMGVSEATAAIIFAVISIWELIWSGLAMWRASKRNDKLWFIVFLVLNLLAIPEIIYLIVTKDKVVIKEEIVKKKRKK